MIKVLGVLLLLSLAAGGAVGIFTFQLSDRIDEQDSQLARLREEIATLRERSAESPVATSGIAPGAFDLPGAAAASAGATEGDAALAATQAGGDLGRLVQDERMKEFVAELARQLEGRVEPTPTFLASPEFKEGVRTTLDEIREEQRAAQEEEREARMVERTQERAREIAERLALTPAAAEELAEILVGGIQSRRDAFALVESGQIPRDEVRQVMREQRDETNSLIQNLLTPTQYAEYQKIEEEQGPGRGGRGFFGGPIEIMDGVVVPAPAGPGGAAGGAPPAGNP